LKTIIAGSRDITDIEYVEQAIEESGFTITEVFSGTARGVDLLGESWALANQIPIKRYRPDWNKYGKQAGIFRNLAMITYADALIAIWDGESRGTKHCIEAAKDKGLKVYVKNVGR
jgi:hypothetical protein